MHECLSSCNVVVIRDHNHLFSEKTILLSTEVLDCRKFAKMYSVLSRTKHFNSKDIADVSY